MGEEDPYRELFERSPDAILIIEGDRFVDCNPAAVRMLRFPDKKALQERYSRAAERGGLSAHPSELSPPTQPDGRDSFEKAEEMMALASERGHHTFEWVHLCADGETLLVEVQLTVVRRGEKPTLHVVWRDISERKRLEAELQRTHRLESVGRLAGGVAHDFNNILMVILSHAELLRAQLERAGVDLEHVKGIEGSAGRAAELTHQLLAFSRGEPAQSRPIDLGNLVEGLGGMLRRLIGEHIELDLKRENETLTVVADPSQLEQLVVNLAANARDAMPDGGRVAISVGRRRVSARKPFGSLPAGPYVALSVADSGAGMTHEQLDRAFDPFYTTKGLGGGTGLGLATVHAIAEQSGGHASIESELGLGTTVQVLFPLTDRVPAPTVAIERRASRPARGGETILLVEDEERIRGLFEQALTREGYRVLAARDGQDALEQLALAVERIDLLVTDVVMPHVSGPELVRRLSGSIPELRVLYMSGYSDEESLSIPSAGESAVVLRKPFSPKQLHAEVRKLLDK